MTISSSKTGFDNFIQNLKANHHHLHEPFTGENGEDENNYEEQEEKRPRYDVGQNRAVDELKTSNKLKTLQEIQDIEHQLTNLAYNNQSNSHNDKEQIQLYATKLKDIRNSLESLVSMGVIDDQSSVIEHLSDRANEKLHTQLKAENIFNLSLTDIFNKTLLTYEMIFLQLFNPSFYEYDNEESLHYNFFVNLTKIVNLVTKENLLYFGIGIIALSFILYFILVTK